MKNLLAILILALVTGACSESVPDNENASAEVAADPAVTDRNLPPGFLDEPPPPPTSNSLVLSGGILVSPTEIADSIVVVTDGRLVAWGKRGAVEVPDDSIGHDMRGKYIVPGDEADMAQDSLPVLGSLALQVPASFLIMEHYGSPEENLLGYLKGDELVIETETD